MIEPVYNLDMSDEEKECLKNCASFLLRLMSKMDENRCGVFEYGLGRYSNTHTREDVYNAWEIIHDLRSSRYIIDTGVDDIE